MGIRLNGATSGYVELVAPAVAGTTQLVLPTDSIQPGMVLVAKADFSTVSGIQINNCFTSLYDQYLLTFSGTATNDISFQIRLRAGGVDSTTGYKWQRLFANNTTVTASQDLAATVGNIGGAISGANTACSARICDPARAVATTIIGDGADFRPRLDWYLTSHTVATAYDGFNLYPNAGTISGSVYVYGYRKA